MLVRAGVMADAERDARGAHAALPRERAFVLQLTADSDPPRAHLAGRLVHIESGDATRFDDLEQLLGLLGRDAALHARTTPGANDTEETA